jgi:hypothetical protein
MEFTICTKAAYCDRKGAKRFLRKRSLQYKQRTYLCDKCGWYHNTSLNAEERRLIKEFNSGENNE